MIDNKVYTTDESKTSVAPEYALPDPNNPNPVQPSPNVTNLEADLLIGEDTGNHIITKSKTDKMDFVGALNVKPIKDELIAIEEQYQGASKDISLKDLKTTFTAELTLSEGLTFPKNVTATLAGANGKFEITNTTINGQTATVTLTLKDSDKITLFTQLKEAVLGVEDQLKVTLPGVTFKDTATAETAYKVTGKSQVILVLQQQIKQQTIQFRFNLHGRVNKAKLGQVQLILTKLLFRYNMLNH